MELRFPALLPHLASVRLAARGRPARPRRRRGGLRRLLPEPAHGAARAAADGAVPRSPTPAVLREAVAPRPRRGRRRRTAGRRRGPAAAAATDAARPSAARSLAGRRRRRPRGHRRRPRDRRARAARERPARGVRRSSSPTCATAAASARRCLTGDPYVAAWRWADADLAAEGRAHERPQPVPGRARASGSTPTWRPRSACWPSWSASTASLPGKDCAACGAPTCAAFAEDIVTGRATRDLCPYAAPDGGATPRPNEGSTA